LASKGGIQQHTQCNYITWNSEKRNLFQIFGLKMHLIDISSEKLGRIQELKAKFSHRGSQ
ncbi:hypothetical protein SGI37_20425, partial [Providencia rettgeri]